MKEKDWVKSNITDIEKSLRLTNTSIYDKSTWMPIDILWGGLFLIKSFLVDNKPKLNL